MQNCLLLHEGTRHYKELEPTDIQNATASTTFLKRGQSMENKKLLLSLSDIKVAFSELERYLVRLIKRTISIVSIQKHKHASFPETYAQEITLLNSCCYILCISCQKSYPLDFVTILPFMAEIFLLS